MLQCVHTQLPIRFGNGSLAMHPLRLHASEPGAFARQRAHDHATAACLLDAPVVCCEPRPHGLADRPRGVVPDQPPRRVPCRRPPCRPPRQTRRRHGTDRTTVHQAAEHALCVHASPPRTCHRLGGRVVTVWRVVDHGQRLVVWPGLESGLGGAAPPPLLILQAQHPVGRPQREYAQAIAPLFFRAYGGAGLVIPCCARFPCVRSRGKARRRLASLSRRSGTPCASPTCAARASVPTPVGVPSVRGD